MNSTPPEVGIEKEYSQGVCEDGAAILCDGQPLTIEEILQGLRERDKALGKLSAMESKAKQLITNACCTAVEKLTELAPNQGWDSGDVVAEMYIRQLSDKPVPADKPTRITEQDAREIIGSYEAHYKDDSGFDWWFRENGPALLNKLNADREQVPAVAVPDCARKVCEAWAERERAQDEYDKARAQMLEEQKWNERAGDVRDEFDRLWRCNDAFQSSIKAMVDEITPMLAAAPSHSQQSARSPQHYAIEHAEYMAVSGEQLMDYLNEIANEDDGVLVPDDRFGDYIGGLRSGVYEFRKRRDRCSSHESEQGGAV